MAVGLLAALCAGAVRGQSIVQEFYVPLPEEQVRSTFLKLHPGTGATFDSVISVVLNSAGTRVTFDHWEDGYEIDLNTPTQSTSRIWGDGVDANGIAPGYGNDPTNLPAGTVFSLRNNVALPRNPAVILYDGRDRIGGTKAIVVSRAQWALTPGSVLASAVAVPSVLDFGTDYRSPVGENVSAASMFEVVDLYVMAAENGTSVSIDKDTNGVFETVTTLNRGESYRVNGGVLRGARVTSSKPVEVHLMTGDIAANYEQRSFTLTPTDQWSARYYTPVGTAADGDAAYAFVYNGNTNAISVGVTTLVGSTNLAIAAGGVFQYQVPQNSGARFQSTQDFFVVETVGANPAANNVHDWGFSLVPEENLTTILLVGWGPGSSDLSQNGSPIWITPANNTTVYVDYDGDRTGPLTDPMGDLYDVATNLTALQSARIYDPDFDQTAMRLYTLDGTLIAGAWGQDPAVAGAGNPFLDMGTTVLPFPEAVITKTSTLFTDNPPTGISTNDILEYAITIDNNSVVVLGNVIVLDTPPPSLTYVTNTSSRDAVAVTDSTVPPSSTFFPFDESGYVIPIISRGSSTVLKYRARVLASGSIANGASIGGSPVVVTNVVSIPGPVGSTACALDFTDGSGTAVASYSAGAGIFVTLRDADANTSTTAVNTITVTVQNPSSGDLETITLTELSVNTNVFRNSGALPSSTTAGVAQQDGTVFVSPGHTLSVTYTDPVFGDVCSDTATISTPSEIKVLYLSTDGSGSPDQDLDRIDPVAAGDSTTATSVVFSVGGGGLPGRINVSTGVISGASSGSITHLTSGGTNRLLVVGVSIEQKNLLDVQANVSVTSLTYGVQSLTRAGVAGTPGTSEMIAELWYLVNPSTGSASVTVSLNTNVGGAVIAAVSYTNVNQTTPISAVVSNFDDAGSATATVTIVSSTNALVMDLVAFDSGNAWSSQGTGQTQLWNLIETGDVTGVGSFKAGAASVTMTQRFVAVNQWAMLGASIQAPAGGVGTNRSSFVQTPALCGSLSLPAGGTITITNFLNVISGTMPTNPLITARLLYGTNLFAMITNPVFTTSTSNLVWSTVLTAATNIPSGQAITFEVTSAQPGVTYSILYDSTTKPSKIRLPTTSIIDVSSIGVYDAPYPGGSLVSAANNGNTLYVRTTVTDPFGAYDITSLGLVIDASGTVSDISTTLTNNSVVATNSCSKTFEYVWITGTTEGNYTIAATANEGTEGITDTAATSVNLSFLDLGTPCAVAFTLGNNGPVTNTYGTNVSICVRVTDIDQNTNSLATDTVPVILTSSSGDTEPLTLSETTTNSGIFAACVSATNLPGFTGTNSVLSAPAGSVVTLSYVDPNDSSDPCSDVATVPPSAGTPGLSLTKTLISPADGQAVVGEAVQFRLRAVNTGSTTLNTITLTDSFPSASFSYVSATPTPNTVAAGLLTWTNIGPLTPGNNADIYVNFLATNVANQATNSGIANAGGGTVATGRAPVLITRPVITVNKSVTSPIPGPVNKGSNVVFRIALTNTGTTAITTLPLEDTFSGACLTFVSANPTPDASGFGSLLWNDLTGAGSLAAGGSITVSVTFVAAGGCNPAENLSPVSYAVDVFGDPVPPVTSMASITTIAARITGTVYDDPDRSGTLTGGDTGLPGITVQLFTDPNGDGNPSDGALVDVTATSTNGSYEFLNLGSGNYVVVETDPLSYVSTGDTAGANDNRIPVVISTLTTYSGNDFFDTQFPSVAVQKTVNGAELAVGTNGAALTYSFVVSNPGSITLTNVTLSDPLITFTTNIGSLSIGESRTVTVSRAINSDLTNSVTATGLYFGTGSVSGVDTAIVDRINPLITIANTAGTGAFPGGEIAQGTNGTAVTYWFVVQNAGDVTLTNVTVTNNVLGFFQSVGTLAAGQSVTVSVLSVISADLTNSAVARGFDPLGGPTTANDPSAVDLIAPTISIAKTVNGVELVQGTNGAPVTYRFVVNNSGDVTLTNVLVTDPLLLFTNSVGTLTVGQSLTVTAARTISSDLTNTATVAGTPPTGVPVSSTDTAVVDRINPAINIEDTVSTAGTCPGVELVQGTNNTAVTYCFIVSNPGDVTLTNVVVTNNALGFAQSVGTLAAGQTVTVSVNSTISGDLVNTAVATGFDPVGNPTTDNDTSAVDLIAPAINVEDTVSLAGTCPGAELVQGTNNAAVTYCFIVSNPGDVTLTNVVVTNAVLGFAQNIGTLSAGQTVTVSVSSVIGSDLTNTATARGFDPLGLLRTDADPSAVDLIAPSISVAKTVNGVEFVQGTNGAAANYSFVINNAGDVTLTNVVLSDPLLLFTNAVGTLTVGQSVTVTAARTISSDLTNLASVAGTPSNGVPVSSTDTAVVDRINPAITVAKTVNGVEFVQGTNGAAANYSFVINNAGDVTLTNVVLTDPLLLFTNAVGTLTVGQSVTVTAARTISGDLTNTANVVGTPPTGIPVSSTDTAVVDRINPAITVAKTVNGVEFVQGTNGADANYSFVINNAGDVTLTNVVLTDPLLLFTNAVGTLTVGQSVTVTAARTISSDLTNTANVAGTPPTGIPVSSTDTAVVDRINPAINIEDTISANGTCPGVELVQGTNNTAVTYCFIVSNPGDVTLTNVVVTNNALGFAQSVGTLTAGQTVTVSVNSTISGDLVNTAVATGFDPVGNPTTDNDTSAVNLIAPAINIENTVSANGTCPGVELVQGTNNTAVTYCFIVSNPGDVTLTNVVVTNSALGFAQSVGTLTAGQTVTVSVNSTISADLVNTAVATGFDPVGVPTTDSDNSAVDLIAPAINIENTVSLVGTCPGVESVQGISGTPVTYCFIVSNIGDVSLTNVVVTNNVLGFTQNVGTLAAGQVVTVSVAGVISGDQVNAAVATGSDPVGGTVTDSDNSAVDLIAPSVAISKSIASPLNRSAVVGEDIEFSISVTNTGDITLDFVPVVDTYLTNLLTFVSATPSQDLATAGSVVWSNVGPLSVGGSVVLTSRFTTLARGIGTNVVLVSPTLTNSVPVPPSTSSVPHEASTIGIEINKLAATGACVCAGGPLSFSVTVTNAGNAAITNLNVVDLDYASGDAVIGTLLAGASTTYVFSITVAGESNRIYATGESLSFAVSNSAISTWTMDVVMPTLIGVPANATNECSAISSPAVVTATDACDASVPVSFSATTNGFCPAVISRVWSASDDCGNSVAATQLVTVVDTASPTLVGFPANATNECSAISSPAVVTATDACDTSVPVSFSATTNGSCPAIISRVWSASDDCGNSVAATQLVTVVDTASPTLVGLPANATNECSAISSPAVVTATDACDSSVPVTFSATTNGSCPAIISRVWSASDDCGNSVAATQLVTVVDTVSPALVGLPANATNECSAISSPAVVTATDACDASVPVSFSATTNGSCPAIISRVWSASDDCGNSVAATQLVTVVDTAAPTLVGFPANATNECSAISSPAVVTATDACDASVPVSFSATTNGFCPAVISRVWSASDDCGNSVAATQLVTVVDTAAPTLVGFPVNATNECSAISSPVVVTASDACDASVPVSFSATTNGSCPAIISRVWSASDDCGNSVAATQLVTVVDTTAPSLVGFPADETNECSSVSSPAAVTATDNCDLSVPVSFSAITNGACPAVISRVWSASDDCGNSVAATQLVTVVDTTAPSLVGFPADETNECSSVSSPATVTATDNCDLSVPVSFSAITNGACPAVISRVWSASDDCGNSVAATQLVTVVDTTAPNLVGLPVNETNDCSAISSPASVTATDACDASVPVSFSATTNGSCPAIISRVWSASDECGNSVAATQLVTVVDAAAPTLVGLPVNATNECSAISSPAVVTATDACDTSVPVAFSATTNGACPAIISRVWSASDDCGNSVAATQLVTVVDTTAPSLVGLPANATNECSGISSPASVTATDNCDASVPVSFSATTNGACPAIISRVWSASDDCGNSVVATQLVTVVDTASPTLVGFPANATNECDAISSPAVVTATDACDTIVPVSFSATTNGFCPAIISRVWSAVDDCGNSVVATQSVTVVDTTSPSLVGLPVNATNECSAISSPASVTATDNCDLSVPVSFSSTTNGACPAIISRVWSASDDCGNSVAATQLVTVVDTAAPSLVGLPVNATNECSAISSPASVTATDLCDVTVPVNFSASTNGTCPAVISRIWSATDDCGNSVTATQLVTVVDTTAPALGGLPANETNECSAISPPASVTATDLCDVTVPVSFSATTNGSCPSVISRVWSATDDCGNNVSATQLVTVVDTAAPSLVGFPANETNECSSISSPASVSATDLCDVTVPVSFSATTNGACPAVISRVWSASDDCGNSVAATQLVTVVDTTAPGLVGLPANTTNECSAISSPASVTAADNCDTSVSVSFNAATNGSCPAVISRVWSATDDCGNSVTATQLVAVVDTAAPSLVGLPANETNECSAISAPASVTATDLCDVTVPVSFSATTNGACPAIIARVWSASDDCGNNTTATQLVTVVDTTAPSLVGLPANVTNECSAVSSPASVTATDLCDVAVPVSFSATTNGACPAVISRVWSATDDCGNSVAATQLLTVVDTAAPSLVGLPADETNECSSISSPAAVTASDLCDVSVPVSFSSTTNGACPAIISRVWSATDDCGNSVAATQLVTVVDTTAPGLVGLPANETNECSAISSPAAVTASDLCDVTVPVSFSATTNGSCPSVISRVWSATDDCGNSVTATQLVNVVDTTAPSLVGLPLNATNECSAISLPASVTATDNCDAVAPVSFSATTNGACPAIISRVWSATDDCGNSVTATQLVTVVDTASPSLVGLPANATNECSAISSPALVTATDNCDLSVPVSFSAMTNGACPAIISRVWSATDDCGNNVAATQLVTVVDTASPSLVGLPVNETNECSAISTPAPVTALDLCDVTVPVSFSATTNGSCPAVISRVWFAADDCGNSVTATQLVTVVDTTSPSLVGLPANETNECSAISSPAAVTATDNCDATVPVSFSATTNGACPATISRVWSASDDCGNSVAATQLVTVVDTTAPGLVGLPANETNECSAISSPASVTASDLCDVTVPVSFSATTNGACPAIISRVWSAMDDCGNNVTATQLVTVVDTTSPGLVGLPANATNECSAISSPATVTATDNCDVSVPVSFSAATNGACPAIISRVWSATDDCGNNVTATQLVTVVDTTSPGLVGLPANATNECSAISSPATVTATDNCDVSVPVSFSAATNGACPAIISRVWSATDDCGNNVTATQLVTVVDTTTPSLVGLPANATNLCSAISSPASVTATDNCDVSVPVNFSATTNGACPAVISRVWTAADDCGNSATATQLVTVVDTAAPSLVGVPANATNSCSAISSPALVTGADSCSSTVTVTFVQSTNSGSCVSSYTLVRRWTGTDPCGNTTVATQLVSVVDTAAPILSVPTNVTVSSDSFCLAQIPAISNSAVDACAGMTGVTVVQSPIAGTPVSGPSTSIVQVVATDACGNRVTGNVPVVVTCPLASVGDFVWQDANRDGIQNGGETGLVGVVVTLFGASSNIVAVTTSAVNGAYGFANIFPGTYFLGFSPRVGYAWTLLDQGGNDALDSDANPATGRTAPFTLLSGEVNTSADAGYMVPAAIRIEKSPDLQVILAGSNATFTITVTNDGPTALTNVVVSDPLGVACGRSIGTLLPGARTSYVCTVAGVANSFTNVATVSGYDPFGNLRRGTNDAVVQVIRPALQVSKNPSLQQVISGGSAVFSITVTNSGDVALTNVAVADALAPQCNNAVIGTLLPGQSLTYNCTVLNVTQDIANVACASGYDPLGGLRSHCDRADVVVIQTNRPGCTRTATFWYCHPTTWPVQSLLLGNTTYNQSNILYFFSVSNPTDVTWQVVKQQAAAKLNVFAGADASTITQTINDADAFLVTYPPGSNPLGAAAVTGQALADALLAYNNGATGPGACFEIVDPDFDGDFVSDLGVYWPAGGRWYALRSTFGSLIMDFGWSAAIPIPADYDGDGRSDVSVYHPGAGNWYVLKSDTLQLRIINWGWSSTVPVPADYDGDGFEDLAVYNPAGGTWYIRESTNKAVAKVVNWGFSETVPALGDYDGDRKADVAVYHPITGTWYINKSTGGTLIKNWGWSEALPVPGDYDGDGLTDVAVYHPGGGKWYISYSGGGSLILSWGWSEALAVPGDYDGDGKTDISVFHRATGTWYIRRSEDGTLWTRNWGWSEVVPVLMQWQINHWMNSLLGLWPGH